MRLYATSLLALLLVGMSPVLGQHYAHQGSVGSSYGVGAAPSVVVPPSNAAPFDSTAVPAGGSSTGATGAVAPAISSASSHTSHGRNPVGYSLSEDELSEFRRDFAEFDQNNDALIDAEELRVAFARENVHPEELYQFFFDVDEDDSGTVTLQEYLDYAITLST
eukprot:GHVT01081854.1.p1 GENE.GHVT01081854.1~~GHVT01081854.1.p1  ORF type:complete len:164 (+),score=41.48 GHVT01081854.1:686-1177(+)